jgi:ankyrin repeat protein
LLAELLLANGADASVRRSDGFDAIGLAHAANQPAIVALLTAKAHADRKQKH